MDVVVLSKFVPNPDGVPEMGEDFLLKREGVEAALQLVDQAGGEVTVVSMGPEVANQAVRKALSMGAHKAVLVTDPSLRGRTPPATRPSRGSCRPSRSPSRTSPPPTWASPRRSSRPPRR